MASFLDDLPDQIADALGDTFRDAILTRDGAPTGPTYDPTPGGPAAYPCRAINDEWSAFYRQGGLVGATDRKVLVLASTLATKPQAGDRIEILADGVTLTIVPEGGGQPAVSTDPATAVWTLRARV